MNLREIIKSPIITEKNTMLNTYNQYTFEVDKRANKIEIAKAVEALFNVKVAKVATVNTPQKKVRRGWRYGTLPGIKKAIVTLKEGHKIEFVQ